MLIRKVFNIRHFALGIALAILLGKAGSAAHGQEATPPPPDSERVIEKARYGGVIRDSVVRSDGKILAAEGSGLVLFRTAQGITDVLARTQLQHGEILDLAEAAPYTLVLAEDGLLVLPDSGDEIPDLVGFAPSSGQSMDLARGIVAIAAQEAGIHLLRLEDNGSVTLLSTMAISGPDGSRASAESVTLSEDSQRAYVTTKEIGLYLVDVANPSTPVALGPLQEIDAVESTTSTGPLLAVGNAGTIQLVDPTPGAGRVGIFDALSNAHRIVVQEDYAYIADASDGLKIFWLAAPDRPVQIYGESAHPVIDLKIVGDLLVAVGTDGLRVLSIGNRYRPVEISRTSLPGTPTDIELSDSRAFVSLGDQGVAILDLTNFSLPRITARIPLGGPANASVLDSGILYVAAGDAGIAIINARTPGAETIQTTLATPGTSLDVDRRGNALIVAADDAGVLAFDLTNPFAPALVGTLALDAISNAPKESLHRAETVTISGKRAYVSEGSSFLVVDISRPDRLRRLTRIDRPSQSIGLSGVYMYAASGNQIGIYDARATAEPIHLRTYWGLSHIAQLSAQGDRIYATSSGPGPDVVAISLLAPDFPIELDNVGDFGDTWRATPSGNELWVAAGFGGLRRYGVSEGGALIPRGAYTPISQAAVLAIDGTSLVAGGEYGWTNLDTGSENNSVIAQSPDRSQVRSIALDGNSVVVAHGEADISLYDLQENNSSLIANQTTHGPAAAVALDAQYVYAADAGGLSIFDRQYLLPIARVGTPSPATGLAIRGSTAYLTLFDGSLAVIAVGDPMGGLRLRRSISTPRPTSLIAAPDGRIYGLADNLISHFSIQNLDTFGVVEDATLPIFASNGYFFENLLAAFLPGEAIDLYDLSRLDSGVVWQGSIDLRDSPYSVESSAIVGGYGYLAFGEDGLGLIDLQAQSAQGIIDSRRVHAVLLVNKILFAAGSELTAWDVTNPGSPIEVSSLPLTATARALDSAPDGSILISTENGLTLAAWDGSTLTELGHFTTSPVDHATQIGTHAFLALHNGGLQVIDIANPRQSHGLFTYVSSSGQFVHSLLPIHDSNLLVSWDSGIDVLSIDGAIRPPQLVETLPTAGTETRGISLNLDASLAAVTLGAAGVQVFDLSDPLHPTPAGFADTPGVAQSATIQGSLMAVADGICGMEVLNISNPDEITSAGYWRGGYLTSVVADTEQFYAGGGALLFALQFDPASSAAKPTVAQDPFPASGELDIPLDIVLQWGPRPDPCKPVTYEVYLGSVQNPPLIAQVNEEPTLDVGQLAPSRTYYWHVDTLDPRGERIIGPNWTFTTSSGFFPNGLPPAPPVFIDRIRENPAIPLGMVAILLATIVVGAMLIRTRRIPTDAASIPEWYSTQPDEEEPLNE